MARQGEPFDEIMIVNPLGHKGGGKRMRFYPINTSSLSGYFAEAPEEMGFFAETPDVMGYGEVYPEVGYFADPPPGFTEGFGQMPTDVAYFAEAPEELGYVCEAPETVGSFAGCAACPYSSRPAGAPKMMGYGQAPPEVGYFAEAPELAQAPNEMGYVYEVPDYVSGSPDEVGYFAEAPIRIKLRDFPAP